MQPQADNYNLHVLPQTMTTEPQPEKCNLQVLHHGLPQLPQADATAVIRLATTTTIFLLWHSTKTGIFI